MSGEDTPQSPGAPTNWQFKPGDTVGPAAPNSTTANDNPVPQPDDHSDHVDLPHQDEYIPENPDSAAPETTPNEAVTWSASEFIHHHKSFGWYALLALVGAVVAAGVFYATKDKISTAVIIIVAIVMEIYAARKPQTIGYKVDDAGLTIGEKFYDYALFRSFAVVDEDAFASVVFMPLKRFMPLLTVYFSPSDESKILSVLSNHLPTETHELDVIDQLMRRIRF